MKFIFEQKGNSLQLNPPNLNLKTISFGQMRISHLLTELARKETESYFKWHNTVWLGKKESNFKLEARSAKQLKNSAL